jgi:adenylyl-sulfate kinase
MNKGLTLWFTGLPCSGKSTLAEAIADRLRALGRNVELLDGDVIRTNLSKGLGFSREDRDTNIRRVAFVCDLLARNGVIAISACISPYREIRDELRESVHGFVEIYARCPIEVCIERDVKGMYARALAGEMKGFTGVDDPYEEPLAPDVVVDTDRHGIEECVEMVLAAINASSRTPAASASGP